MFKCSRKQKPKLAGDCKMRPIWIVMIITRGSEIVDNAYSREDDAISVRDHINAEMARLYPATDYKEKAFQDDNYAYIVERTLNVFPDSFGRSHQGVA